MTPGCRPAANRGRRYTRPHASGPVRLGLGTPATERRPRWPGVHPTGRQGRRPIYRPPVDTTDTPPVSSPPGPRFLTLDRVAEELSVSRSQVYALVRDRALAAVKIGGRGQWRVERSRLEDYIAELYLQAETDGPGDLPGGTA